MSFEKRLNTALQQIDEGHWYRRKASNSADKRLNRANVQAGLASGMPAYPALNAKRQQLIKQIEAKRPLRASEFIHLYGYEAWVEYLRKHNLPDTHKWADAHLR